MLSVAQPLKRLALLAGGAVLFATALHAQTSVLTWHNDNLRTGQNLSETTLTPSNVNSSEFGLLFTLTVDGKVDAQPLYVPGLTVAGAVHNVVYIATENDSVYAFDADEGTLLKQVSLLVGTETPSDDRGCDQVTPIIGITSTPVIDPGSGPHGTIYAVAMSKDSSGGYHQRLHALDLTTLAEEFNGPVTIAATFAGSKGVEKANSGDSVQTFLPSQHKERAALLLSNGVLYMAWSSHCDAGPYTGWVMGYNESNLEQTTVIDLTPNGNDGGMWAAGSGPEADSSGNVYVPIGNGTFDTTLSDGFPANDDYGNGFVKMSTSGGKLSVLDYFTMSNTVSESGADTDLASGGGMLLPPLKDSKGNTRNLAVAAGKDGNVYVMDTSDLGKFNSSTDSIYQQLSGVLSGGMWSSPAWFNGTLYYGAQGNALKAFAFANGVFGTSPSSQTSINFTYPGTTPSISANGTSNGIVWAYENSGPAVLHAYEASNLANELYNSNQAANARDQFGDGNKFMVPTVVNGKVYVAANKSCSSNSCVGELGVFGLLNTPASVVSVSPNSGSGASQTFAFTFSDSSGASGIVSAMIDIGASLAPGSSCYLYFSNEANAIYLANDAGTFSSHLTLGTSGTISNSQCAVNAGGSSVSVSGNNLTLSLEISFQSAYAGAKNIYLTVYNGTTSSTWASFGNWMVTSAAPPPDFSVSVTPGTQTITPGGGTSYNVTATALNGFTGTVTWGISGLPAGATGGFNPPSVSGSGSSTLTVNSTPSVSTGNSTVTVTGSSGALSHNATTMLDITTSSGPPASVSVTPNSGSGSSQTFAFLFTNPSGGSNIVSAMVDIGASLSSTSSCYLFFSHTLSAIYLANDAGTFGSSLTLGTAGTMSNSQCTVNAAGSSVSVSGNNLTLNLEISFQAAFSGGKNIYMTVYNGSASSVWAQFGTWTASSTSSPGNTGTLTPVSVTPNSGSGSSQTFAFLFTNPSGGANIVSAMVDIGASLASTSSCYLYFSNEANAIYLANDAGTFASHLTLGTAGTISNSQCSVNSGGSSVSVSGNNLTLSLEISFQEAYAGAKNIYLTVYNGTVSTPWTNYGAWTVQ